MLYNDNFAKRASRDSVDFVSCTREKTGFSGYARRTFNEVLFQQSVMLLDRKLKAEGKSGVSMSYAQALHTELCDSLYSDNDGHGPQTMNTVTASALSSKLNHIFDKHFGYSDVCPAPKSEAYNSIFDRFKAWSAGYMVPISPFDERYCFNSFALNSNGELFFANAAGPDADGGLCHRNYTPLLTADGRLADVDLSQIELYKEMRPGDFREVTEYVNGNRDNVVLESKADRYGMSVLSKYIPDSTSSSHYKELCDWAYSAGTPMSKGSIHRAMMILDYLQQENISYEVLTDRYNGQLKARLDNQNIEVRLFDKPINEQFIGRVYVDGLSYSYWNEDRLPAYERDRVTGEYILDANGNRKPLGENNKPLIPGEKQGTIPAPYYATPEEVIQLIDFALGKDITVSPIGRSSTYKGRQYSRAQNLYVNKDFRSASHVYPQNGSPYFVSRVSAAPAIARPNDKKNSNFPISVSVDLDGKPARDATGKYKRRGQNTNVIVRVYKDRNTKTVSFVDSNEASDFIKHAVDTARDNFISALDVDRLFAAAEENKSEEYYPVFSGDEIISSHQSACWDAIRKSQAVPGYDPDVVLNEMHKYARDICENDIGFYDDVEHGAFNPVLVARYMEGGSSVTGNREALGQAVMDAGFRQSRFLGDESSLNAFCESLIEFDNEPGANRALYGYAMSFPEGSKNRQFLLDIYETVRNSITHSGCDILDPEHSILIDDNGILEYTAYLITDKDASKSDFNAIHKKFVGHIGQVFIPDGKGLITTKFNGRENYMFAPGYEGYVVPQRPGENKSFQERVRVVGYEQMMLKAIAANVSRDIISESESHTSSTKLNYIYRRVYDERYPLNQYELIREEGLSDEDFEARLETQKGRVHFPKEYRDKATVSAQLDHENARDFGLLNDLDVADMYVRTDFHNMAILYKDNYFSPTATSSGVSQGINRYLCKGTVVNPDGSLSPVPDDAPAEMKETALINRIPYHEYDTVDRTQMVFSNQLKARAVIDVGMAFMNFNQENQNDGIVISSRLAERYKVRGEDGEMRPLLRGDKFCEFHGNKFTISKVVDVNMDMDEAERLDMAEQVKFFRDNPHVDAVAAPYSFISRFNAGSVREAMDDYEDIIVDGKTVPGGMGHFKMMITDMTGDKKLHTYDLGGRSFSPQLAAAFVSAGAEAVIREIKGPDTDAFERFRETLLPLGLDIDEYADVRKGFHAHENEQRHIVYQPLLEYTEDNRLDVDGMTRRFMDEISSRGGFLEIPFDMTLPSGVSLEPSPNPGNYLLPLLPPYLRDGRDQGDDETIAHYYTRDYENIFRQALYYRQAMEQSTGRGLIAAEKAQKAAESALKQLTDDLISRTFDSKHGMVKSMMGRNLDDSATSVWVANPNCNIDEITMSPEMAAHLKVNDGDYTFCWRDPIISDGGCRYLKVVIDSSFKNCIGVHPAIVASFEGDFDGDTVGLWAPKKTASRAAAYECFSMEANLVNDHHRNKEGLYDLDIDMGLDMQAVLYERPDLQEKLHDITVRANSNYKLKSSKDGNDRAVYLAENKNLLGELNFLCQDIRSAAYGIDIIRFDSNESFMRTMGHCAENGAKGSYDKALKTGRQLGLTMDVETDENGKAVGIKYDTIVDHGHSLATDQDRLNTMFATATKSHCTGFAGKKLQLGLRAFLDGKVGDIRCCKAVMELTSVVTQSLLQVKHEADRADLLAHYLSQNGPVNAIWSGKAIHRVPKVVTETIVDSNGVEQQVEKEITVWETDYKNRNPLTVDEWKKQFIDFHTSKDGLDVPINTEYVDVMAEAMKTSSGTIASLDEIDTHKSLLLDQAFKPSFSKDSTTVPGLVERIDASPQGKINLYDLDVDSIRKCVKGAKTIDDIRKGFDKGLTVDGNIAYVFAPQFCIWNVMHKAAPKEFDALYASAPPVRKYMEDGVYQTQASVPKASRMDSAVKPKRRTGTVVDVITFEPVDTNLKGGLPDSPGE